MFNLLSHATVLSTGNASVSIGGGSFTVESGSLLGPRGMWGPGVLAVAELKGTITGLTVTSGAASLKVRAGSGCRRCGCVAVDNSFGCCQIYENGVAQPVSQGSINYFDCSPNGSPCYPKDPLSLFLTAPGESSSSFTVRVPFRMPRAQATVRDVSSEGSLSCLGHLNACCFGAYRASSHSFWMARIRTRTLSALCARFHEQAFVVLCYVCLCACAWHRCLPVDTMPLCNPYTLLSVQLCGHLWVRVLKRQGSDKLVM